MAKWTNNVPNTFYPDGGNTFTNSVGSFDLECEKGYIFDGDITVKYNSNTKIILEQNETKTKATKAVSNYIGTYGVTFNGKTKQVSSPKPPFTGQNNVPNTVYTDNSDYDAETLNFVLTCDNGYIFDGQPTFKYRNGNTGLFEIVTGVLSENDTVATFTGTGYYDSSEVVINGNTKKKEEPKVYFKVTTGLTNCNGVNIPEQYEADTEVTITLKANANAEFVSDEPSRPVVQLYDKNGDFTAFPMNISEDKKTASLTILLDTEKYDPSKGIYIGADAEVTSVIGEHYGAINVYLVTLDDLEAFSKKRFFRETGKDPSTGVEIYENIDLGEYVNRIKRIYTNINSKGQDVIRCGNYNTEVNANIPETDKITLDFGTAVVPAHNEDNTDYESEIQIFLPFAGFVNLNTDYAGKTIALQYVINVVTGDGVALLSCNGVVFQVEETEPSSEIIYLSPSTQVKTVGGDDWNERLYYGLEPYIYCKWYESASNGRNTDRQAGILGNFRGFNMFDDVTPIHTAEMLTEEQEMIYTALSDGVYIE